MSDTPDVLLDVKDLVVEFKPRRNATRELPV